MKKSRIILLVTMLLLVASTCCTVWGKSYSGEEYKYNQTYQKTFSGARTTFMAKGTGLTEATAKCYTAITNDYTTSCYMDAYVYEMDMISGLVNYDYSVGTYGSGYTLESGDIARDYNNTRMYYEHKATCYQSPYQMTEVDTYYYKAKNFN